MRITSTPRKDGFWMPGEFEPQEKCYMIWPERLDVWHSGAFPAQKAFAEAANAIIQFEALTVLCSHKQYENARMQLDPRIRLIEMSTNDAWVRDSGPTFVKNAQGEIRAVDWKFNAWGGLDGGLYFLWNLDDYVA